MTSRSLCAGETEYPARTNIKSSGVLQRSVATDGENGFWRDHIAPSFGSNRFLHSRRRNVRGAGSCEVSSELSLTLQIISPGSSRYCSLLNTTLLPAFKIAQQGGAGHLHCAGHDGSQEVPSQRKRSSGLNGSALNDRLADFVPPAGGGKNGQRRRGILNPHKPGLCGAPG
jgi:hypothetical protein